MNDVLRLCEVYFGAVIYFVQNILHVHATRLAATSHVQIICSRVIVRVHLHFCMNMGEAAT